MTFQTMVKLFAGDTFIDPGSRACLHMHKWYILEEGGSSLCTPYGFSTKEALRKMVAHFPAAAFDLHEPSYLPATKSDGSIDHEQPGHFDQPLWRGSIVLGRDLFHFWASNNPARLVDANREMLHHG